MVISRFDLVTLITVVNVKYLSCEPGTKPSTGGIWTVVGAIDDELLVSKDSVLIKIPRRDVLLNKKYRTPNIEKMIYERRKAEQEEETKATNDTGT